MEPDPDRIFFLLIRHADLGPLVPGVPYDGVGEVVLLDPHLPARHHVRHNVLTRGVDVDPATYIDCWLGGMWS